MIDGELALPLLARVDGVEYRLFVVRFALAGGAFQVYLYATDAGDAARRLRSVQETGCLVGELVAVVDAASCTPQEFERVVEAMDARQLET